MADNISKKQEYPETTPETASMLGIGKADEATPVTSKADAPGNLPIIDAVGTPVTNDILEDNLEPEEAPEPVFDPTDIVAPLDQEESKPIEENPLGSKAKAFHVVKTVAPYIGIFIAGLFLYQYFFSGFSVAEFIKNDESKVVESQSEVNERLAALKVEKEGAYRTWISQFFYEVSDPSIIDMDNDISGNGLTNFEKFMLNLNPKAYDTLGRGQPDGQTVMDGINPWTGKPLSDNQKKIVELYFDRQIISNRLAAGSLKLSQNGISNANSAPNSNGYENPSNYSFVDGTGAPSQQVAGAYTNQPQQILGTGGTSGVGVTSNTTTGQGSSLRSLDINTDVAGQLNIPANKITAPLIFSKSTRDFDKDLTKGVIHYPGTALPGEIGTSYISGHSSGYSWQRNAYKNVFRGLNNVKDGTSFTITVTLKDNRKATIHYVVQSRQEFAANDQAQFVQTAEARVALSTCWPLDTSSRRLVLFAKQTQVSF